MRRVRRTWLALLLLSLLAVGHVAADAAAGEPLEDDSVVTDEPVLEDDFVDASPEEVEAAEQLDQAVLIVHKRVLEDRIVQGRNMTMVVTLYNVGTGSAEDVHVEDVKANGTDFQLVEGSLEHTFSSIDAGRSAEFKYILIPRLGNRAFYGGAAQVTYASAAGKEPSKLISNIPLIAILSTAQYIELRLVKVGQYLTFGMLRTSRDWINSALTIGIGGSLAAVYYGSKTLRHTRSQSRHEAALRDLNK